MTETREPSPGIAPAATDGGPRNLSGGGWLLADMSLNIWALTIVKWAGLEVPAPQLVFLRAAVGLLLLGPWLWTERSSFERVSHLRLHALRVALSTIALTASFFAVARLPFALYAAIQFTRPIVLMLMAALLLAERISWRRRVAAGVALIGVLVAIRPGGTEWTWGLPAVALTVLCGTGAIIATRKLHEAPTVVMMTFYTAGLAILTAPLAAALWVPLGGAWPAILAIGVFAQSAQFCFLRAQRRAEAGFLAIMGYLALPLSTAVGWLIFDEVPDAAFALGAVLIVGSALWVTFAPKAARDRA